MFFDYLSLTLIGDVHQKKRPLASMLGYIETKVDFSLIDPNLYPNYNQTEFENAFMTQIGLPFTQSNTFYSYQPIGNPIKLAFQIHNKWRPQVKKEMVMEEPLIEILL